MRQKFLKYIFAAIVALMMTSCYSVARLSNNVACLTRNVRTEVVTAKYTGYPVCGGGFYIPQYNCTVWGKNKEPPYMLQIGSLIMTLDRRNNIIIEEGNGHRVVVTERAEKKYRVGDYLVEVLNAGWECVYITNPYGYRKQFILLPYQR